MIRKFGILTQDGKLDACTIIDCLGKCDTCLIKFSCYTALFSDILWLTREEFEDLTEIRSKRFMKRKSNQLR